MTAMERNTVRLFAGLVAVLVLLSAFFTANRPAYMDEFLMFNPAYMVAHHGKLALPVHGYDNLPVIVHPPIHVGQIGLLCRLGFTWYYAEAIPTAVFLLLAIWIVVRGAVPTPVKLGLLFGVGFLMSSGGLPVAWFGTRPEGELHAAWFAALLLLEAGRLNDWNCRQLFGGAFLLTWASSVHYYATPAVSGLAVYLVWAILRLGWRGARPRILALTGGSLLFALPYLAFYIVPNWHSIAAAIKGQTVSASAVGQHLELYRQWAGGPGLPVLLRRAMGLGVPLMVFSTALLAAVRATRGMAIASLPLQLGIFFFAAHKQPSYLIHELALFPAALAVGGLSLVYWLARRPRLPAWSRGAAMAAAAVLLCLHLGPGFASARATEVSARARFHPGDLARAACKQILGPNARVVGRMGSWYSAGGALWHEHFHDLIGPGSAYYDPVRYLENFDAAADYEHFSGNDTLNTEHKTLSYWYSTGLLKLRGFYFAEEDGDGRLVLMSVNRPPKVVGYAARHGALYRFDESPAGDYDVITATCPHLPELEGGFEARFPRAFIAVLQLPASSPHPPDTIVTVLTPRDALEPAGLLRGSCTEVGRVRGSVSRADAERLVASLRREDTPIRFYSDIEDMPGFQGVGIPPDVAPPTGTVPLPGVVTLSEIDPANRAVRIERTSPLRVTARTAVGDFAVYTPMHAAGKIAFPLWFQLRVRVLSGRVGLAATTRDGNIVTRSGPLLPSPRPVEVALQVPDPSRVDDIVVFSLKPGGSQVEILDVTAMAPPRDAAAYRRLIAAGGPSEALGVPADLHPPGGMLRLDPVVHLSEVQPGYPTARIERLPRVRVTTPDLPGAFSASFPLHFAGQLPTAAWVQLRLRVLSGRIGLAALDRENRIVARSGRWLLPTAEPVDAALRIPDPSRCDKFMVFNGSVASASQVEILDIGAMISREDAPQGASAAVTRVTSN